MKRAQTIRIATRSSPLAVWQANEVKQKLELSGHFCEFIFIESEGDLQLSQPIYAMGISGVFTKQLDTALLNDQADIAVHSLKDVPTQVAEGLVIASVLRRGAHEDIVVYKHKEILDKNSLQATIASSSLRRRAQWLAKFPNHQMVPIRGNVQTRLKKFEESKDIDAVIFAKAGLERLNILPGNAEILHWMLPAPAQGIVGIVCRDDDREMKEICNGFNHRETFIAGFVERQFMKTLMGGCSVPISALAEINGNELEFRGAMHAYDGSRCFTLHHISLLSEWEHVGKQSAEKLLLPPGAQELIEEIRNKKMPEGDGEQ